MKNRQERINALHERDFQQQVNELREKDFWQEMDMSDARIKDCQRDTDAMEEDFWAWVNYNLSKKVVGVEGMESAVSLSAYCFAHR